jgi:hypothetical protein
MKLPIICFIIAVGLLAVVTSIPRSRSISTTKTGSMLTLQEMQSGRNAKDLPVDEFDDRALVFPRESKP